MGTPASVELLIENLVQAAAEYENNCDRLVAKTIRMQLEKAKQAIRDAIISDVATKSAPPILTPRHASPSGERLPSSDAAVGGADTTFIPAQPVAWRALNDFGHWYITQDKALADTYRDTENKDVQPLYLAAQSTATPVETEKYSFSTDPCDQIGG